MSPLFKRIIILWFMLFTNFLFADTTKVKVVSNGPVTESSGPATFTISLTDGVDYCDALVVNYTTINGSASAPNDYTAKSDSVTFYGECNFPVRTHSPLSTTVSVAITNDSDFELNENFSLKLSSVSAGYSIKNHYKIATVTIKDDDVKPLKLILFNDRGIQEGDINRTLYLVAYFNKTTITPMTLTYHTENASALAGSDYEGIVSKIIPIPVGKHRVLLPVIIKGDLVPEPTKNFKIIIDSISEGTIRTGENIATASISDDDNIIFNISSTDILEGNPGDNNKMKFRIFLNKALPVGTPDITIHYVTTDGSTTNHAELSDSDYTQVEGDVIFHVGDLEYFIEVPITPDTRIEPDETLRMVISRDGENIASSEAEIIRDDGNHPGVNFSTEINPQDHSVIEGNSSTRVLNFHFTLDADAVAGTSFKYHTANNTAKTSNNDYVETNGTYNVPVNTRDIDINIPVNGDVNIEKDELFYLIISEEHNMQVYGHIAKGYILNDDGTYPALTFDSATYDGMDEGDSSTRSMDFTLSLNKPAIAGSSFNYYTEEINATKNSDYINITPTAYTFVGGETNVTLHVTIKGDTVVEKDEFFQLVIDNFNKLDEPTLGRISAYGEIRNDDSSHVIKNIGEFRFDDCGTEEWRVDSSSTANNALGSPNSLITNDDKSYMCGSLSTYHSTISIPHHLDYEIDEGVISMLLYDHHNVGGWLFQKGNLKIQIVRVGGDVTKGSLKVMLNGNTKINTNEIFFTNSGSSSDNLDTQWIHVAVTFGSEGMKLYINGVEKGSNSYTGGIKSNTNNITLSTASGYFDEFYMFEGQMNNSEIQHLYDNLINNINIDGTTRDCGCYTATDPFTCDSTMYISSSTNRETSATGRMWLHRVDTATNPFDFRVVEPVGAGDLYNATAYNPDDDYIYGLYHRELIKITRGGDIVNLGHISALPSQFEINQLYAGAISNGYYYVGGRNSPKKKIYKIDINSTSPNYKSVTTINLTKKVALQDFSFYKNINIPAIPEGTFLYGIDRDDKLTKVDVRDGTVTQIGSKHIGYEFDSSFSDKTGRFFANDSKGNGFFEFDLTTGEKSFISDSQSATFNDGANCINASLVFTDYGDAPSSYGLAKHNIANGIFMGDEVDHDVLAYSNPTATGDDNNGIDDEDGITLSDGSDMNGSFFEPGTTQDFKIKVSKNGYLNAWIDYNLDGDFEDSGEKIFSAKSLTQGEHALSFNVPTGLTISQTSYIRFRFSSTATLNPTQSANDGEVEDYAIKFGTDALRGVFNIERINSGSVLQINSEERNAWYTQIVGRDFDYSIVFYDENMSSEQVISNLTCKVELVNMENNTTLYERYFHIPASSTSSRFDIRSTNPNKNAEDDDLSEQSTHTLPSIPASRNVRFRISYEEDGAGNIIQTDCTTGFTENNYKTCYNNLTSLHFQPAKDNFAIRPKGYYLSLADKSSELRNSQQSGSSVRVASGYEYNLTMVATGFNTLNPAKGFNQEITRKLNFMSSSNCHNTTSPSPKIRFSDGLFVEENFTHDNVGEYSLQLVDDNNWTYVDKIKHDCTNNSLSPVGNGSDKIGCNIIPPNYDIDLSFYPYQFGLDTIGFTALPVDDNEFLYMDTELNDIAVQLKGKVIAQNKNGDTTTNFTKSCFSQKVTLSLDVNSTSDTGVDTQLKTTPDKHGHSLNVLFNRSFSFNNLLAMPDNNITDIQTDIILESQNFLDHNNSKDGSVLIDLRYNISKNINRTINPIEVGFKSLTAISNDSHSNAEEINNWIPKGSTDLNQTRFFYFTQVAPDMIKYPDVNFIGTDVTVNTPLSVDIFCLNTANPLFCEKMNILKNSDPYGSPRKQKGWYISINHNQEFDGNITALTSINNHSLEVTPNVNIDFIKGYNNNISSIVKDSIHKLNKVKIIVPSQLKYLKGSYSIPITGHGSSKWSGIGKAGRVISTEANTKQSGKNDW